MDRELLKSVVEGMIFASGEPLTVKAMADAVRDVSADTIQTVVDALESEYRLRARGFILARIAGGYQFRSLPEIAEWIIELKRIKPAKLGRASMETLAVIAYNQPVTRGTIEAVRGVESSSAVKTLTERGLVEVVGRKDVPGRPLLYGTTARFLEVFGLPDLASLPSMPQEDTKPDE
ncbi:MAG: SMC-Scp complex subunit ScpB [Pseudomonadota bacterium]